MSTEALRELISAALTHGEAVSAPQFYAVEQKSDGSPLEKDQCALMRHLLGLKEGVLSRQKEKNIMREVERGLILACLGKSDLLIERALFHLHMMGMQALGVSEKDYDASYFFVLESLILQLTGDFPQTLPPYFEAIKTYLLPRSPLKEISLERPVQGIVSHETSLFRLSLTCQGGSSGFGGIYKEKGKIITFGPCFFPLGISDHFGIFRTQDGFQDVLIQENPFRFSGWARAAYHEKPTNLWTFIDFSLREQGGELKIKFNACGDFTPCAFVFFIEADRALVNGKHHLRPGTLDRYQEGSAPVVFGENNLTIKPLFQSEMQLIPLSGSSHYWGAQFLLAFAITDEAKTYSFEIK